MSKPILVSIVIVAYNVVEYLSQAIESVISQWDEYCELIIVNDGATDGAYSLLEEYKAKIASDRFVVIHKANGGVSDARNVGVSFARGEYIAFLDGDDFLVPERLKLIKNVLLENKPDCLVVNFNYYTDQNIEFNPIQSVFPERKLLKNSSDRSDFLVSVYRDAQLYPWKYILNKDILIKYQYPVGKTYEDVACLPLQLLECESLYYLPLDFIQYRQRSGSIMRVKSERNILSLSSSLLGVTDEILKKYNNKVPKSLSIEHSVFNLYIFTWACGDSLSNKDLNIRELYDEYKNNFNYSNLEPFSVLKNAMNRDKKNWRKFFMFYNIPGSFYLAHYLRHNFNKTYKILNKIRELVYKT
ncbi:glycosyltransferase family 2 protein [Actinobacillus vicugnae]|uniref:glycosyltransferase family 2 protein n=1 Tax=Actinobacillus vicugnae TaxID=2573093 RepID=UPI00123FC597|nr:glycosyltransferase family A protein [Actinobacillus vicugnae]